MLLHIICRSIIIAFDGITIDASVETTLISANINTFDTVADSTLVFIFPGKDGAADNPFYQFLVDA